MILHHFVSEVVWFDIWLHYDKIYMFNKICKLSGKIGIISNLLFPC